MISGQKATDLSLRNENNRSCRLRVDLNVSPAVPRQCIDLMHDAKVRFSGVR